MIRKCHVLQLAISLLKTKLMTAPLALSSGRYLASAVVHAQWSVLNPTHLLSQRAGWQIVALQYGNLNRLSSHHLWPHATHISLKTRPRLLWRQNSHAKLHASCHTSMWCLTRRYRSIAFCTACAVISAIFRVSLDWEKNTVDPKKTL